MRLARTQRLFGHAAPRLEALYDHHGPDEQRDGEGDAPADEERAGVGRKTGAFLAVAQAAHLPHAELLRQRLELDANRVLLKDRLAVSFAGFVST